MKSIEELRKVLKSCTSEAGIEPDRFDTYWITAKACDMLIDEIEAEIAERYMELPVDADGVPIHMGDTVEGELVFDDATAKGTVTTYHIHDNDEPDTVYIKVDCGNGTWTIKELRIKRCHHVKPRTLEDVLVDMLEDAVGYSDAHTDVSLVAVEKYADEIRELLGFAIDEPDTIRNELMGGDAE